MRDLLEDSGWMTRLGVFATLFLGMAFFGSGTPTAKIVTAEFPLFLEVVPPFRTVLQRF
tara:strand:+ start:239 stop:415 length:177 start_codon:yes stop_codon:yes gene_type:complete